MNLIKINDDFGWIIEDITTTYDVNFFTPQLKQSAYNSEEQYPQFTFMIYVSDRFKDYSRIYLKLQDLLAVIGGFMKLIFKFLNIFNFFIRVYLIDNFIMSKIFEIENVMGSNLEMSDSLGDFTKSIYMSKISFIILLFFNKFFMKNNFTF